MQNTIKYKINNKTKHNRIKQKQLNEKNKQKLNYV